LALVPPAKSRGAESSGATWQEVAGGVGQLGSGETSRGGGETSGGAGETSRGAGETSPRDVCTQYVYRLAFDARG